MRRSSTPSPKASPDTPAPRPYDVEVPFANSYQLELEEVGKAVRGEDNVLLGRADALGQARAIEALEASAATGKAAPVTRGA